jgi:hypothetical protein
VLVETFRVFIQRPQRGGTGRSSTMGIGVSVFLLAVGAIMTFALNAEVSGLDLDTVGVILMVVGVIGLLFSMMFWSSWGGFNRTERTVVRDREVL